MLLHIPAKSVSNEKQMQHRVFKIDETNHSIQEKFSLNNSIVLGEQSFYQTSARQLREFSKIVSEKLGSNKIF